MCLGNMTSPPLHPIQLRDLSNSWLGLKVNILLWTRQAFRQIHILWTKQCLENWAENLSRWNTLNECSVLKQPPSERVLHVSVVVDVAVAVAGGQVVGPEHTHGWLHGCQRTKALWWKPKKKKETLTNWNKEEQGRNKALKMKHVHTKQVSKKGPNERKLNGKLAN